MITQLTGAETHIGTGGVSLDNSRPGLMMIHGAGMDATVWQLQTRYLANRGIRVMAVDLPGHGLSQGEALATIEEMAHWLAELIGHLVDDPAANPVCVAGHSMGTLVALELAATQPDLVSSIVLAGTADVMRVNPDLLAMAEHDLGGAAALMAKWSHNRAARLGPNPAPGQWMIANTQATITRTRPGVVRTDLVACDSYERAIEAASEVSCPVTVLIGEDDKMSPPAATQKLLDHLPKAEAIRLVASGHMMMSEQPQAVRTALMNAANERCNNGYRGK